MPKFSVITICFNAEKEIEDTILSVLNQTTADFEYLVKDGVSTDRTVDIARSFIPAFAEKGIPYRVISQPDSGVYDAMNQAVQQSQGEWMVFMNSGDCFANETVLDQVKNSGCLTNADVVYGDTILKRQNLYSYGKAYPLEKIQVELPFCHQSSFTRRELFQNNCYSTQYRICSDHRFYLQLYREGKRFAYFPMEVSIFDLSGISSTMYELAYRETIQILEEMPDRDIEAIRIRTEQNKRRNRAVFLHEHLWKYIPKRLRQKRREWMDKNRKNGWKTEEEFFGQKKENP